MSCRFTVQKSLWSGKSLVPPWHSVYGNAIAHFERLVTSDQQQRALSTCCAYIHVDCHLSDPLNRAIRRNLCGNYRRVYASALTSYLCKLHLVSPLLSRTTGSLSRSSGTSSGLLEDFPLRTSPFPTLVAYRAHHIIALDTDKISCP